MMIKTTLNNINFNNQMFIVVQSKTQKFNIQLVKLVAKKVFIEPNTDVELYRIDINGIKMYLDSTGKLIDCLNALDKDWYIYIFTDFNEFYNWFNAPIDK